MEGEIEELARAAGSSGSAVQIEIVCYTDPLCCWSWASLPGWRRLRDEMGPRLSWRWRMAGMIADWGRYQDPVQGVARPVQMGPIWVEARHLTGAAIDERIWVSDPPASSYPACLAVKAAGLQGRAAEEACFERLSRAVMTEGCNIARREVLLEATRGLAANSAFDPDRFAVDLDGEAAQAAFRDDLKERRFREIGRFPTLTIRRLDSERGLVLVGYRPYAALARATSLVADSAPDTACTGV